MGFLGAHSGNEHVLDVDDAWENIPADFDLELLNLRVKNGHVLIIGMRGNDVEPVFIGSALLNEVHLHVVELRQISLLGSAIFLALQNEVFKSIGKDSINISIFMNNLDVKIRCLIIKVVNNSLIIGMSMSISINNLNLLVSDHLTSQETLDGMMFVILRFDVHIEDGLESALWVLMNVELIWLRVVLVQDVNNHDLSLAYKTNVLTVDVALHVLHERQAVDFYVIVIVLINVSTVSDIFHKLHDVVIFDLVNHQAVHLFHEHKEESSVWTELNISGGHIMLFSFTFFHWDKLLDHDLFNQWTISELFVLTDESKNNSVLLSFVNFTKLLSFVGAV